MEHVEGTTLADRIGRRGLPLPDALKHAAQIADALARRTPRASSTAT